MKELLIGAGLSAIVIADVIRRSIVRPKLYIPECFFAKEGTDAKSIKVQSKGITKANVILNVGDLIYIVEDNDTGKFRNKIGTFMGFFYLENEDVSEGFIKVGDEKIRLSSCVPYILPKDYKSDPGDVSFGIGMVRIRQSIPRLLEKYPQGFLEHLN